MNIKIGDLVCENFHTWLGADDRKIKKLRSWYMGIVVRVSNTTSCVSYMNHKGLTLTNFAEKLTRLNDR